jgi:hypothetical protein
MKTQSINWTISHSTQSGATWNPAVSLNSLLCQAARVFVAFVPALAIVVLAAWAITVPSMAQLTQASMWATGFIFLALAIESRKPTIGLLLSTGVALPVLALLSSHVAVEFAVIAAALVALWVGSFILRR